MKTSPNKVQILNENGDKQSQNTLVETNIFAKQKLKDRCSELSRSHCRNLNKRNLH